jgi:hypothetical protein
MNAWPVIGIMMCAFAVPGRAEVVEEETWYNAEGKVVKTVKRVPGDPGARSEPAWEPAWVRRERARDGRTRVRYSSPPGYRLGSPRRWGYYSYPARYYYPRSNWSYCNRLSFSAFNGRLRVRVPFR